MNMLTRLARALAALAVLMAVIFGGAWALIRFGRLDALTSFDWRQIWVVADDGSLVLGVITLIGWLAWTLATLSVVSELIAVLSRQRLRLKLPGLGIFTPASAVLVTAIVGLVAAQTVTPATSHAVPAAAAAVTAAAAPLHAPAAPVAQQNQAPTSGEDIHIVQAGDDLWSLAEHYFGDGSRWRQIAAANDTVLLAGTEILQPGMALVIPELPGAVTLDSRGQSAAETVVVQTGDTLSGIAESVLGDVERWPELAAANTHLVVDPDLIEPGWELRVPTTVVAAPSRPGPVERVHEPGLDRAEPSTTVPAPVPSEEQPPPSVQDTTRDSGWVAKLPAAFGVVLTGALVGAYTLRRHQQAAARPLGYRMPPLAGDADRLRAALASAAERAPTSLEATRRPLRVGFEVPLGARDDGPVNLDLAVGGLIWVNAEHGDDVALATAVGLALACADDELNAEVIAAGPPFVRLTNMDEPRLVVFAETHGGVQALEELLSDRRASMPAEAELAGLRTQPDLADAWRPVVVLLATLPSRELPADLAELGVTVLVCAGDQLAPAGAQVIRIADGRARWLPEGPWFEPHLVSAPARRVLEEVFATANLTEYPIAPWWDHTPDAETAVLRVAAWPGSVEERPVDSTIEPTHPVIKLLGPVELLGARGEAPKRAIKQMQEYCAWLLEHPAATARQMTEALMVAEATRRSNMSRLRVWLGKDANGALYLPDAYTGTIALHPGVTSDWEQLQLAISAGVNRVSNAALIRALGLVRGAPLADAAPGQWHWAEQLRADICATVRDIGVVLAGRAIELGDLELASWAVDKAWLATPEDDVLVGIRLRLAHLEGDQAEVDRLVLSLTRRSRNLGVDLSDELVTLLQEVVEGRSRLRA